jgi:hypothetical protein
MSAPADRNYLGFRDTAHEPIEMLAPAFQSAAHFWNEAVPLIRPGNASKNTGPVREYFFDHWHRDA